MRAFEQLTETIQRNLILDAATLEKLLVSFAILLLWLTRLLVLVANFVGWVFILWRRPGAS